MSRVLNVTKKDGKIVEFSTQNIRVFLENLALVGKTELKSVDLDLVIQSFETQMANKISTTDIYDLLASTLAYNGKHHYEYAQMAGRVLMAQVHKNNNKSFSKMITQHLSNIDEQLREFVQEHSTELDGLISSWRDFNYDYFAVKTLCRSYLMKTTDGQLMECPQYMWLRVAVSLWFPNMEKITQTYNDLSDGVYTHATPTLYNAGTKNQQLASCFLLTMQDDSIDGIFNTIKQTALISKYAGGVGVSCSNIRGRGSHIHGTGGKSNGLVPMLRCFNATARYVDQGGGKRKGSFAFFLEPWHIDIMAFLELRLNHGVEESRTRDLFPAIWMNDLFMERLVKDGYWTLFSPSDAPELQDAYGTNFEKIYQQYEKQGGGTKIKCNKIWSALITSQIETGLPYVMFKDSCNKKSNQQNLGTIRSSNLCCEIVEYTSPKEIAVCTLASIALPGFYHDGEFDFDGLHETARRVCANLNQVIDRNVYPVEEARSSNLKHRPIAIGVQGFHDLLQKMEIPFESNEANRINSFVFETIYHGALTESNALAQKYGSYESFGGSPASEGKLQFDFWETSGYPKIQNWSKLPLDIISGGLRNSLLCAQMPTASTAQILNNSESTDPIQSNLYSRRTLSGEFIILNKYLVQYLEKRNLWNETMVESLLTHRGSVQNIDAVDEKTKKIFKNAFELKQRHVINLAKTRGPFICQSQSMNLFFGNPNVDVLSSALFYAWKCGLKTGIYYTRTAPAANATTFTVKPEEECLSCSA